MLLVGGKNESPNRIIVWIILVTGKMRCESLKGIIIRRSKADCYKVLSICSSRRSHRVLHVLYDMTPAVLSKIIDKR